MFSNLNQAAASYLKITFRFLFACSLEDEDVKDMNRIYLNAAAHSKNHSVTVKPIQIINSTAVINSMEYVVVGRCKGSSTVNFKVSYFERRKWLFPEPFLHVIISKCHTTVQEKVRNFMSPIMLSDDFLSSIF